MVDIQIKRGRDYVSFKSGQLSIAVGLTMSRGKWELYNDDAKGYENELGIFPDQIEAFVALVAKVMEALDDDKD